MKKLVTAIAFTIVGMHASLFAAVRPAPCTFAFTGEWVYYTPLIDNPYYVINRASAPDMGGPRKANTPSYDSGFRVQGMYAFENCLTDFRLSFTHFGSKSTDTITKSPTGNPDRLFLTQGTVSNGSSTTGFQEVISVLDFQLNRIESAFGYRFISGCNLCVSLEGGLQYSRLNLITKLSRTGGFGVEDKYTQSYWGIGPQIGLDSAYSICGDFSFVGSATSALLLGENHATSLNRNTLGGSNIQDFQNQSIWRIVPSFQMRLGFSYILCGWNLEAGYEYLSYIRALGSMIFTQPNADQGNPLSIDYYTNADYHGPYVSASFCF